MYCIDYVINILSFESFERREIIDYNGQIINVHNCLTLILTSTEQDKGKLIIREIY